ncbi:MAG: hypothetical protein JNL69_07605 [Bacteroidia bacterium]|nr:hypothetical protein [Bacteroidia bacterium]
MNKVLFYSIIILLFSLGAFLKFSDNQGSIPKGCDEFGYLNLAKSFSSNNSFSYENTRPYLKELVNVLKSDSVTAFEIAVMLTPYAYFTINDGDKVANQYPPATSYVLSLFSLGIRKKIFPAIAMFLFLIIPIVFIKQFKEIVFIDLILVLLAFFITLTAPFITELNRVNSLAFTFGFLIAAGFLLKPKPLLSCFLIAITINFRIANVLMLFPLILFVDIALFRWKDNIKKYFFTFLKYTFVVILAISPYLVYVYLLLGNPLASTYSTIDTETTFYFLSNIKFYFYSNADWFVVHLILIVILSLFLHYKKIDWKLFLKYLLFPLVSYLFFMFHKVQVDYYPYASSMILVGIVIHHASLLEIRWRISNKWIAIFSIVIALISLLDGVNRYFSKEHISFEEDSFKYKVLCQYDIVWCDLLSGTTEYVCNNNGFKYDNFTLKAKKNAISFLKEKKYTQVILLNDNMLSPSEVINEVEKMNFEYEIKEDESLGQLLIIK